MIVTEPVLIWLARCQLETRRLRATSKAGQWEWRPAHKVNRNPILSLIKVVSDLDSQVKDFESDLLNGGFRKPWAEQAHDLG